MPVDPSSRLEETRGGPVAVPTAKKSDAKGATYWAHEWLEKRTVHADELPNR